MMLSRWLASGSPVRFGSSGETDSRTPRCVVSSCLNPEPPRETLPELSSHTEARGVDHQPDRIKADLHLARILHHQLQPQIIDAFSDGPRSRKKRVVEP